MRHTISFHSLRWVFDSTILRRVEMQHGDSACVCAEVGRPARRCGARIWFVVGQPVFNPLDLLMQSKISLGALRDSK